MKEYLPPPAIPTTTTSNSSTLQIAAISMSKKAEALAPTAVLMPRSFTKDKTLKGEFLFFSELPMEIRLKIWYGSMDVPNVVTARLYEERGANSESTGNYVFKRASNSPVPSLLHTCQESRQEALKVYKLGLGEQPTTYINYAVDYLHLDTRNFHDASLIWDALSATDRANTNKMWLKISDWAEAGEKGFREQMWRFSSLRLLRFFVGDIDHDEVYGLSPKETRNLIKDELKDDEENRPQGWVVPKVIVIAFRGIALRKPNV